MTWDTRELLMECVADAIAVFDEQFRYVQVNAAAADHIGQPCSDILGHTLWEIAPPGPETEQRLKHAMREQVAMTFETPVGEDRWWETRAFPARGGLVVIGRDVTAQVKRRTQTQISEHLGAAQELSLDPFMVFTPVRSPSGQVVDFAFEYVNPAAARMLHKPPQELAGAAKLGNYPHLPREILDIYIHVMETGERCDQELFYESEGICAWFRITAVKLDDALASSFQDITARKRTENALLEKEQCIITMVEGMNDTLVLIGSDLRIKYLNRAGELYFGKSREQVLDRHVAGIHPRFAQAGMIAMVERTLESREPVNVEMASVIWPQRWVHLRMSICAGSVAVLLTDLTARKQAEANLRESEQRAWRQLEEIEALYRGAPVGLCALDTDLRFVRVNERMTQMSGLPVEAHLGHTIRETLAGLASAVEPLMRQVLEAGEAALNREVVGEMAGTPGVERAFVASSLPLRDQAGKVAGLNVVFEEVTQRRRTEQQLRELTMTLEQRVAQRTQEVHEKVDELRRIAHELTHVEHRERQSLAQTLHDELQQLLVAAKMRLKLLRRGAKHRGYVLTIAQGLDYLLSEAVELARNLAVELSPPVLELGLEPALRWLARRFEERQHLCVHLEADSAAEVDCSEVRAFLLRAVQELLLNVVKHSRTQEAWVRLQVADGRVRLVVEDRGRGPQPEALPTADESSRGFGLSSIRHRLNLMGGTLTIESRAPGCRVTIEAPKGA